MTFAPYSFSFKAKKELLHSFGRLPPHISGIHYPIHQPHPPIGFISIENVCVMDLSPWWKFYSFCFRSSKHKTQNSTISSHNRKSSRMSHFRGWLPGLLITLMILLKSLDCTMLFYLHIRCSRSIVPLLYVTFPSISSLIHPLLANSAPFQANHCEWLWFRKDS